MIDEIYTIITHIIRNVAKGYILQSDLTLKPCYVIKHENLFAHGDTIRDAQRDLQAKIFDSMDADEKISLFFKKFKHGVKYPARDFYEWHHTLTGSCEAGRNAFVKSIGANLETDEYTVDEFIQLTENAYGGNIIKQLKEIWGKDND